MEKVEKIKKKWYIIDADNKPLGRVATLAASILLGKHRSIFTPHIDSGEYVIIINVRKVIVTGKKFEQKKYYWHTGYVGHLREISYRHLIEKKPIMAMKMAVEGMIPHNSLGKRIIKKLHIYEGAEHKNQAQKPIVWGFESRGGN
jgi:large subunit ribosomal protein L13